jgi:hypothetical protein
MARTPLYWATAAGLFILGLPCFWFLAFHVNSDLPHHARFVAECITSGIFPLDFLYYGSVAVLSGFSTDLTVQLWATIVILSAAVAAKFLVTTTCLGRWLRVDAFGQPREFDILSLPALGLVLLFCLPLPGMNWYLGQFPPNVWHNSTTIALMPFAVLLFYHSARFLETGEARRLVPTTVYMILGFLTKPSLFFVFAVVFPIFSLLRMGIGKRFAKSCIPVAIGGVMLIAYAIPIFLSPEYSRASQDWRPSLELGWLDVWRLHSSNIPLSILNSLLLPLLFLACYPRQFLADLKVRYSLSMLTAGLLLFAVVQETGPWGMSGNLSWQNIVCNYLLHCAIMVVFLRLKRAEPDFRPRDFVLLGVFLTEALLGVLYLVKIVLTQDYF